MWSQLVQFHMTNGYADNILNGPLTAITHKLDSITGILGGGAL